MQYQTPCTPFASPPITNIDSLKLSIQFNSVDFHSTFNSSRCTARAVTQAFCRPPDDIDPLRRRVEAASPVLTLPCHRRVAERVARRTARLGLVRRQRRVAAVTPAEAIVEEELGSERCNSLEANHRHLQPLESLVFAVVVFVFAVGSLDGVVCYAEALAPGSVARAM